jgi:hypothetical protein
VSTSGVISSKAIAKYRLDATSLKERFSPEDGKLSLPARRLINRWRDRAQAGRDVNLASWKLYAAIDRAWDVGYRQATQTIVGLLMDLAEMNPTDDKAVMNAAETWGMTHLIKDEIDPKTNRKTGGKLLNLPTMFGIQLALARSTLLMRISRILNERLSVPLMKFEPAFMSDSNRLRMEIVTQRIETGNREFGYAQTYCEAIQAAAMYGQQLMVVAEPWYVQNDYTEEGAKVGKEGVRYSNPHPSRSYYDISWPTWTFNQDCGVSYVGHWQVSTYGAVRNHPEWWNRDRVSRSDRFGDPKWQAYFQNSGQCRLSVGSNTDWFSKIDRERRLDTPWFTAAEDDQPVWITHHFERFNPRVEFEDPAMPDCDVWFYVILASDDTPLYVTALCERPGIIWLYEPHGGRAIQQGLMLELMPFQDHASNILTAGILGLKQNSANITLYDKDVIQPETVRADLENPGEKFYRKLNYLPVSGRKLLRQQASMDGVFKSYRFPQVDIQEHLAVLGQLVSLMNRIVGMSEQEVGGTASHEQSAEEIRAIHSSTSHRFEYVAAWFDFTFEAWKRQLYTYFLNYSTVDAYAFLDAENATRVAASGFKVEVDPTTGGIMVTAPMDALRVEHVVAQRDGPNRIPWTTIGGQMLTFLQSFMNSPVAGLMPPEQTIKMVNDALEALQFPKSFRIPSAGPEGQIPPAVQAWVQHQLEGLAQKVQELVASEGEQTKSEIEAVVKKSEANTKAYVDGKTENPGKVVIHQNSAPGTYSESQ